MAEAIKIESFELSLTLTEHEARYLISLTQDYLGSEGLEEGHEPKHESIHRNAICNAIKNAGVTL